MDLRAFKNAREEFYYFIYNFGWQIKFFDNILKFLKWKLQLSCMFQFFARANFIFCSRERLGWKIAIFGTQAFDNISIENSIF